MRQWLVDPKLLCRKHLMGEHVETHMFIGTLSVGKSIKGYLDRGQVNPHTLYSRHDELAEEMMRRGYKHQSPIKILPEALEFRETVNIQNNLEDLKNRCQECRKRINHERGE